ncbi:mechanosensitive ion channel domain-containing protein [Flavihumibacter sp. CACIAM 22H1]|uniref:mechanosensitive ion channel family protein n=1 Tax=Flavihumibacter sp. CACIAM 22H1 TaxID=1812911 RepID=UPI000A5A9980|nr:mechanosensitive ion channel domain-containing protein [Flavihumibacter sp. CACIAM 22H1]
MIHRFLLFVVLFATTCLLPENLQAQDSLSRSDSTRRWRAGFFSDTSQLNSSDYQVQIEKTFVALEHVDNRAQLGNSFGKTVLKLQENDSILAVIKGTITQNATALNLRNLQVFRTLLIHMEEDLAGRRERLDTAEAQLASMRKTLRNLLSDTVFRQLQKDTPMLQQFSPQLLEMRTAWRSTRRKLRESTSFINRLQTQASSNSITAVQLLDKLNDLLASASKRILGKESNFLWEKDTTVLTSLERSTLQNVVESEQKALSFYFRDSSLNRLLLFFIGLLFITWTYRNRYTIQKAKAGELLTEMGFIYLPSSYFIGGLVIVLSLAPLFDLSAPSAYVEAVQFLLLLVLTIICWNKWPRQLFFYWIVMVVLYLSFSFTNHIPDPGNLARIGFIGLNILSILFGTLFLKKMENHLHLRGFLRFVIILHNILNIVALFCNLFGRVTLSQLLGNAAIFAFMQAIGLAVFSKICMEALLLQMVASRYRRGLSGGFDYQPVIESFSRPVVLIVMLQWLVVFTTNLNIYSFLYEWIQELLKTERTIGNATFTFGGIVLFFLIIWMAHLLQKYVGYFFGDVGHEDELQNKQQRSRLLITKLIVLSAGYLLAVAASGVPVDKITIVLGALGVGIGLGLQNIVSNFVSGIILIFDRPLQIGDSVEIGSNKGRVREIGLRSSILQTREGAEVIIPNGDLLSHPIINWTLSNAQQRMELSLKISGNDMEDAAARVKALISSSAYVYGIREPQVLFTRIGTDSFDVKTYFWCVDTTKVEETMSDLRVKAHQQGLEII